MTCGETKHHLTSCGKIDGLSVRNEDGKEIGQISQFIVDKKSGKVGYAVVDFCGFMCSKKSEHWVPWSLLTYNKDKDFYLTKITEKQLESSPSLPIASKVDRSWENLIHEHYQTAPYWMECF